MCKECKQNIQIVEAGTMKSIRKKTWNFKDPNSVALHSISSLYFFLLILFQKQITRKTKPPLRMLSTITDLFVLFFVLFCFCFHSIYFTLQLLPGCKFVFFFLVSSGILSSSVPPPPRAWGQSAPSRWGSWCGRGVKYGLMWPCTL